MANDKLRYVLPVPARFRGKLMQYNRLYAFPTLPEPVGAADFVILDSGAYGLSKSGGVMNDKYLTQLDDHYLHFAADNVLCVAPDTYLNARDSMRKYADWQKKRTSKVRPVLQFELKKICSKLLKYQLDFYFSFGPQEVVFFSNPGMRAELLSPNVFRKIKDEYGPMHIHNLGAGWDERDVRRYGNIPDWDSMDSIAYYNDSSDEIALSNVVKFNNILKSKTTSILYK